MAKRFSMAEGLSPKEDAFLKGAQKVPEQTSKQENKFVEMVTFTVRLPRETASALRRVSTERKIAGLSPTTQQEIVLEAIDKWLTDNS
jgi:hypothetical protein